MIKICIVAGARPNFMKIAPIIEAIDTYNLTTDKRIDYYLVHTGQHYDQKMSELFFTNLGIPTPDINLEVGSASHAVQTAETIQRFEKVCLDQTPTHVLVVGDVNSTIACALVASKLGIKVVHVEAGLRSFDRDMPEEINRVLTDAISDFLFITEEDAFENLRNEGISPNKIYFVGNVMIDTLLKHKQKAQESEILGMLGLNHSPATKNRLTTDYCVLTLHRPSNVDNKETFQSIVEALTEISLHFPIIIPVHPRTRNRIREFGFMDLFIWPSNSTLPFKTGSTGIYCIEPLGYLDFLQLTSHAKIVLTDSGGIQEESTILGIPCVTLRENTERPITVTHGTNVIAGVKKEKIIQATFSQLNRYKDSGKLSIPPLWDGKASTRIVNILAREQ
ncbi:MAG TPA: UDP-N-acetylglucosamine 2-epimerase (non-hydrolyzing) [Syntrophales bacterium]|nr:UDP-N-acetylglucosamine 2-epimerase (non-hydrolyzing) [Syntrophales bacterium]